jgi:hypothetical protein
VLRRLYGGARHAITITNPADPNTASHYTSFKQITDHDSDWRIYCGIPFRTDQDAVPSWPGRGCAVCKNNLRPAHGDD